MCKIIKDVIRECDTNNVKKIWDIKYKYKDINDVYPSENLSFYIDSLLNTPIADTNRVLTIITCPEDDIMGILSENGVDIPYEGNIMEWLNYKITSICKDKYSNDEIAAYLLWLLIGV